jgi:hypothetical protein
MKSPLLAEILPTPQECLWSAGAFRLGRDARIFHPLSADETDLRTARMVADALGKAAGSRSRIAPTTRYVNHHVLFVGAGDGFDIPLDFVPDRPEGYGLRIDSRGILLAGADAAGLFYAVQTLLQILRLRKASGASLPACTIKDWPALRHRAIMIDIARQVERADWMEELVRRAAALKKNMFVLYFEDKFRWKKYPGLSHPFGYTAAELGRLARTAEENHMEFVPALASLGHCEGFLQHEEIAHLREEGAIYQLTLRLAGTRRLLEDLYAEILPLYRGRYFHVNCDESPLLAGPPGSPKSYLRESLRLFAAHLVFLHDLLARHGKEMMIWGDMLLHHPEIMEGLPRDIIVVDWDYGPMATRRREAPDLFRKQGFRVMVAPATARSAEVCFPQINMLDDNIPYFIRHGLEAGAIGEMTTAWEMFSTNSIVGWPGFVSSAQYAWNPQAIGPARIEAVVAAHLHGPEAGADVARGYRNLSSHLFLNRYAAEAENPQTRKFRTYHLDSHEFIATDPMVFLTYRRAPWAEAGVEQARKGMADIDAALPKARWDAAFLVTDRLAGAHQAFQCLRRVAVNEAGELAVKAERARRKGQPAPAAKWLAQAADRLEELRDSADALIAPTRKVWAITRHMDDPGLEEAFLRRIRLSRDSLRCHVGRLRRAVAALKRGADVPLAEILGNQPVLVIQAPNPISTEIDLLKPRISISHDRKDWRLAAHKNWFILARQTYIAAFIPQPPSADGSPAPLPRWVRIHTTRTHVDPRAFPLVDRYKVLSARTVSPGEMLDGPPKAGIETADWRLVMTPRRRYSLKLQSPWVLEYQLV